MMKNVRYPGARWFALTSIVLVASLLTACGSGGDNGESGAWHSLTPTIESPLPDVAAVGSPTSGEASGGETTLPPAMGDMTRRQGRLSA